MPRSSTWGSVCNYVCPDGPDLLCDAGCEAGASAVWGRESCSPSHRAPSHSLSEGEGEEGCCHSHSQAPGELLGLGSRVSVAR